MRGGAERCIYRSASAVRDAASPSAAMGCLLAGRAVMAGESAFSALGRSPAAEPEGNAVGSYTASARDLSADRAGQRVAAALGNGRHQAGGPTCWGGLLGGGR